MVLPAAAPEPFEERLSARGKFQASLEQDRLWVKALHAT